MHAGASEAESLPRREVAPLEEAQSRAAEAWLTAYWVLIVVTYALLFTVFFERVGLHDHDHALAVHHQQYWNFRLFGLAKQWTPVMCGGMSLAANPFVHFFSFSMVLAYLIGPFYGLRVATILYFVAGWFGAYLYSGLWMRRFTMRALAASLFIGNGFFICRLAHGHLNLIPFLTLPLLLLALHRIQPLGARLGGRLVGGVLLSLVLGGALALTIDGSPQAFLHFLFWIGVYTLALAHATGSVQPVLVFAGAVVVAAVLDLGYIWPMLSAAGEFPRRLSDDFVNPVVFLSFLILPLTGKVLTTTRYFGHEMSVWIGPVVAFLIWTRRRELLASVPREVRMPWLVTGGISLILGFGSLALLGVPRLLSPFDLLRPLPGFRSMGVTARYWGFLALPLAMLGAQALSLFLQDRPITRKAHAVLLFALLLQLGFQVGAIAPVMIGSRRYVAPPLPSGFVTRDRPQAPGEEIEYVRADRMLQSAYIMPTQGIINCYDNSDYLRAPVVPGRQLVQETFQDGRRVAGELYRARFKTWNWIRIRRLGDAPEEVREDQPLLLVLNQTYNRHWATSLGKIVKMPAGNLAVEFEPSEAARRVDLWFEDPASMRGAQISMMAWGLWVGTILTAAAILAWKRPA